MHLLQGESLRPYNTFGLAVSADYFARVEDVKEIDVLLNDGRVKGLPLLVLGGGSNMLLTQDFKGLVVKVEISGIRLLEEDEESVLVSVGAGVNWHTLVLETIDRGWQGLENLSLIPGNTGAAPIQNIGAYGVELKDVFERLEAYEIGTGKIETFVREQCRFGYRQSVFKKELKGKYIITSVVLKLRKKPMFNTSYGAIQRVLEERNIQKLTPKVISDAVIGIRESKLPDPDEIGNSGSFFKNPEVTEAFFNGLASDYINIPHFPTSPGKVKVPAGWLIEQCGWKGKRVGNTGTYKNQALVLVNYGDASGAEIRDVAYQIIADVESKFGIRLEPEVNII